MPILNTSLKANISNLSRADLADTTDRLDMDDHLSREELIEIAEQLLENDRNSFDNHNLSQMIYYLKNQPKVGLKQIQNVLLDYATRAKDGKVGGGKHRKTRKTRKTKHRKSRRNQT